ncbi:heterokaryon incompatibility protein-domain-containing protein [Xylaria sp. CBS 124048]|nr:heterokaryon incompatibility protein-domain-containing protein [Xylaria sp. CBS 124048]
MATNATYEYTAITAAQNIRLIHLHPGTETDPVHLSLETVALESASSYEAISYCWRLSRGKHEITCNGAALCIGESLFNGLVNFRYTDRTRILWADAVCINQDDEVEKGAQVLLMPHIYSQATGTLVWLGLADEPGFGYVPSDVAASMRQVVEWLPFVDPAYIESPEETAAWLKNTYSEATRLQDEGKPNLLDHDWTPLSALLSRPWFHRKWVVQEVVLAKQVVLYVGGGVEIPWLDLAHCASSLHRMQIHRFQELETMASPLKSMNGFRSLVNITCIQLVQLFRQRATLVDAIAITISFECTDPRDHVYSLLSLGTVGPTIHPDYTASASEVFLRFAISMIVEGQSLKYLGMAPEKFGRSRWDIERLEGLPSWAPDLRSTNLETLTIFSVQPPRFFAGGLNKPLVSVSDDRHVLMCQGRVFDTIEKISKSLIEMTLDDLPELRGSGAAVIDPLVWRRNRRFLHWLQTCYQTAFGQLSSSEPAPTPSKELLRAFSRTMMCGIDGMRNRLPADRVDGYLEYAEWAMKYMRTEPTEEAHERQHITMMPGYSALVEGVVQGWVAALRFCITKQGRFAQVSQSSQPGDRICVLVGGEVPFVVRSTGRGTYTIIGECYVDGIMDGEALEGLEPDSLEIMHFE